MYRINHKFLCKNMYPVVKLEIIRDLFFRKKLSYPENGYHGIILRAFTDDDMEYISILRQGGQLVLNIAN